MSQELEAGLARRLWSLMAAVRTTLFRTNSGGAWLSGLGPRGVKRLTDGTIHMMAPRPVALGLAMVNNKTAPGLGDYTGWTVREIPPEWVGRKVAVFTSVETKRASGGVIGEAQKNWALQVRAAGGIAVISNNPEQAASDIAAWEPPASDQKVPSQLPL